MRRRNVQLERQARGLEQKLAADERELQKMTAFLAFIEPHMKHRPDTPIGAVLEELRARGIVYEGELPEGVRLRRD